jgi:hypothetical protein
MSRFTMTESHLGKRRFVVTVEEVEQEIDPRYATEVVHGTAVYRLPLPGIASCWEKVGDHWQWAARAGASVQVGTEDDEWAARSRAEATRDAMAAEPERVWSTWGLR